ncbi:MAG: hypothetical protein ABSG90_08515 [Dehalococcoidia bacterium]|jgi:hypothetical protein
MKSPTENITGNVSKVQQPAAPVDNISLEPGFEIPEGTPVQREPTYDDVVNTPNGIAYRSSIEGPGEIVFNTHVKGTQVSVGDGFHVQYRDYIETKAGQIRYNIFTTWVRGGGTWTNSEIRLKLANKLNDIQVMNLGESIVISYSVVLMLEIPPQIKSGDYKIGFLIFINGKYYGDLPCVIHVVE